MIFSSIFAILVVLGIGYMLKRHLEQKDFVFAYRYRSITSREYLWSSVIISCLIIPITAYLGWTLSVDSQLDYVEHRNGWEQKVVHEVLRCHRDGSCRHTYQCDPYVVMVSYSYRCGKSTCTGVRPQTRYHSCPYAKEEWFHSVETTLGKKEIGGAQLPPDYASNPWRWGRVYPNATPEDIGHPKAWLAAKERINNGNPGPVTDFAHYENFVLASSRSILKQDLRAEIARLVGDSALPNITRNLFNVYQIDKIYTVDGRVSDRMKTAVHRLSAKLHETRKGDIRVVVVPDSVDIDRYTQALRSYWSSTELQGSKHALPENVLVLVLEVGKSTPRRIIASRAFTGMPTGNEKLVDLLSTNLGGLPFDSDTLFGYATTGSLDNIGVVGYYSVVSDAKFTRQNMSYYAYLRGEIEPTTAAMVWTCLFSILLGGLFWLVPYHMHCPTDEKVQRTPWRN